MSPKRLDQVIRTLREAKRMTQRELAKRAKITPGYVAQLEMGVRKNPSLAILQRLAKALGVPVAELLN